MPPLVLVWANVHGSFFLAPLVLGLGLARGSPRPRRRSASHVGRGPRLAPLAACVTPFGPSVWIYAVGLTTNSAVTERHRRVAGDLDPDGARADLLRLGRSASWSCSPGVAGRRPWPTLAWLGVFFLIGVYAARGIAWWPLAAVVAVAGLLADPGSAQPRRGPSRPRHARSAGSTPRSSWSSSLVGIALLPVWRPVDARTQAPDGLLVYAPPGITAKLRELATPGDRRLQPAGVGLLVRVRAARPAGRDGLADRVLPAARSGTTTAGVLAGGDGWQATIASWAPTIAVIAKRDQPIVDRFAALGWRRSTRTTDGSIMLAPGR